MQVEYTYPVQANISAGAKDLVACLLKHNPMHRLPIQGVLSHPWVVESSSKKPTTLNNVPNQWAFCSPSTHHSRAVYEEQCRTPAVHRCETLTPVFSCLSESSCTATLTTKPPHVDGFFFVCLFFCLQASWTTFFYSFEFPCLTSCILFPVNISLLCNYDNFIVLF